jgi:hypothetical protein
MGVFLEAHLRHRPSFAWKSILGVKTILKNGVGWRVGNGASVRIWVGAWLPLPHPLLFLPPAMF